jgi:hypothetical protein
LLDCCAAGSWASFDAVNVRRLICT